jgi:hypothetical protein
VLNSSHWPALYNETRLLLTTATNTRYIEENFHISTLPDDAIKEISQGISMRIRFNLVVNTGISLSPFRGK